MGVKVYDATGVELTDDSDPQMIFIRDVLLCLSQLEKTMLVQRMAKGRAAKKPRRTGKLKARTTTARSTQSRRITCAKPVS